MVSPMPSLKMEGIVNWKGLKLQAPLYIILSLVICHHYFKEVTIATCCSTFMHELLSPLPNYKIHI